MIDEPVSIFLPCLQNIMSVLSARTGRTSLTRNSILSNFEQRCGHESDVWQEVFSSTLHLSGFVRRGSRENPDRFTDNRAPKAQDFRGVRGHAPPENFFNLNCLKCPLLASGVNRTIYLQVAFLLDGALQTFELFHQSQCPCCNECAARQVLSILSVTSCFVNIYVFSRLKADTFLSH